jgi:hypothetical protein
MLNELAILMGIFGTSLLALDAVKPKFLAESRDLLARIASHDLSPLILFKSEYDEKDYEALAIIKAVGFYVSIVAFATLYLIYRPSDELIQLATYYPASAVCLMVVGYYFPSERVGGWLISFATYMVTPLILTFLFVFSFLSWLLQLPIRATIHQENKWLGKDQAPRVLGYVFLFSSFILQLIALKS